MLHFKNFLVFILFLLVASCYNPKTHGRFISEHRDAWIDGYSVRIDEHKKADKGLVFCRANVKDDGSADPICFKPKFKDKE